MNIQWDKQQIQLLRNLAALPDKLSAQLIAERMRWPSRNAVIGACKRYGVKLQRHQCGRKNGLPRLPKNAKRNTRFNFVRPRFKIEKFKPRSVQCEPLHVSLLDLAQNQCRFAYGDITPYTFCGLTIQTDSSYCPAHHALVWVKPTDRSHHKRAA